MSAFDHCGTCGKPFPHGGMCECRGDRIKRVTVTVDMATARSNLSGNVSAEQAAVLLHEGIRILGQNGEVN